MIRVPLSVLMMLAGLFLAYGAVVFSPDAVSFLSSEGASQSLFITMVSRLAEPFILYYGAGVWLWVITLLLAGPTLLRQSLPTLTLMVRFLSIHAAAFCLGLLALLFSGDFSYQVGGVAGVLLARALTSIAPAMVWVPFAVVLFFLALNGASSLPYKAISTLSSLFKSNLKSQATPKPVLAEADHFEESEEPSLEDDDYQSYVQSKASPFAEDARPFIEEAPRAARVTPSDVPSFLRDTHVDLVPPDFAYEPPSNHFYEVVGYNAKEPLSPVDDTLIELDDAPKTSESYQFISAPENFDETDEAPVFRIPAVADNQEPHKSTAVPKGLYHVSPLATLTIDPEIHTEEAPDPYVSRRMDTLTIERDGEILPPIRRAVENSAYVTSFNILPKEGTPSESSIFVDDEPSATLPIGEEPPQPVEPIIISGANETVDASKIILPVEPEISPRVFTHSNTLSDEEISLLNQTDEEQQRLLQEKTQLKQKLALKMEKLSKSYKGETGFTPIDITDLLNKMIDTNELTKEEVDLINQADEEQQRLLQENSQLKQKLALRMEELSQAYRVGASYHAFDPNDVVDFLDDEIAALRQDNPTLESPTPKQEDAVLEDFIIPGPNETFSESPVISKVETEEDTAIPKIEIEDSLTPDTLPPINYHSDSTFSPFPAESLPEVEDLSPISEENELQLPLIAINDRINLDELLEKAVYVPQILPVSEEPPIDDGSTISFSDIVRIPPVFDETSNQDRVFAHIDPFEHQSEQSTESTEPSFPAQDYFSAPEPPVDIAPQSEPVEYSVANDYFYRPEESVDNVSTVTQHEEDAHSTDSYFSFQSQPLPSSSFSYTPQEEIVEESSANDYFSEQTPTTSFNYELAQSSTTETSSEPLPTFEIPPQDPFEVAINHFNEESLQQPETQTDELVSEDTTPFENWEDTPLEEPITQEESVVEDSQPIETLSEESLDSPFQSVEIESESSFSDENTAFGNLMGDDFIPVAEPFAKDDELGPKEAALMPRFLNEDAPKPTFSTEKKTSITEKKTSIFPNSEELIPNTDRIDPLEEEEEIESMIQTIERTFESFNISMKVVDFSRGPSITRFELDPPSGLKLRTIRNLQDDIALQLGISNIRIISPVEGRSYIGIEVPNTLRRSFMLKQFIDDDSFTQSEAALPLILGMDVGGNKICSDLSSLPHLLVAGTTGSGKSVYINALISGLLFKRSSNDLKFIMIDPKMVELELYNGIPHLLAPIITKPEEAMAALEWAVQEMDRRYRLLSEMGVRNIKEYEALTKKSEAEDLWEHLPYIVIIVDEFANLMLRAPKDTEKHISRLAAMARAVGMHLVVATQRPSVDVVTGVIKANFPCRIAFRVSSKIDSRTILDRNGAEALLGKGDMLYISPDYIEAERMQSPFVPATDVEVVVKAVKRNGPPDYTIDFEELLARQEQSDDGDSSMTDALSDPLFAEVLRYAVDSGEISASGIQRRFRVGYNRASRLIETLKDQRIITPPTSAGKGWQVIISKDEIINFID